MSKTDSGFGKFTWESLGDIEKGRPNLGLSVPVLAYRMMEYTFRDVLISEFGEKKAYDVIIKAGKLAGCHFCKNMLNIKSDFNGFVAELQKVLREYKIGILRVEKVDLERMEMTLTVAEDLDCSGLPSTNEVVCQYDEGFIAGILESFTGKSLQVKEVECWASGGRVCRFEVRPKDKDK